MNLEARRGIIRETFPDAVEGVLSGNYEPVFFVRCPNDHLHGNDTAPKHTCVRYRGFTINIVCQHRSCQEDPLLKDVERSMRLKLCGAPDEEARQVMYRPSREEREKLKFTASCVNKILKNLERIFEDFRDESFLEKKLGLEESRGRFFALFPPGKFIWCGREYDSGTFRGIGHFRTAADWQERMLRGELYPFTSTSIYLPRTCSRSASCVEAQLYRVLEFDTLIPQPNQNSTENQLRGWALFRYMQKTYQLSLALAVHTGNKSPHFWVPNGPKFNNAFIDLLTKIGADPGCLRPAQPVRFPGVMRSDSRVTNQPQCVIAV